VFLIHFVDLAKRGIGILKEMTSAVKTQNSQIISERFAFDFNFDKDW
jgi:hypothetical protein